MAGSPRAGETDDLGPAGWLGRRAGGGTHGTGTGHTTGGRRAESGTAIALHLRYALGHQGWTTNQRPREQDNARRDECFLGRGAAQRQDSRKEKRERLKERESDKRSARATKGARERQKERESEKGVKQTTRRPLAIATGSQERRLLGSAGERGWRSAEAYQYSGSARSFARDAAVATS